MAKKLFTTAKTEAGLNTAINDGTLDAHVVFIEESGNEGIYTKDKIYHTVPSNGEEGQALLSQNGKGVWTNINALDLISYGVSWEPNVADPVLTRVGNMNYHKTLPIQNNMKGCIAQMKNGATIMYFLNPVDWRWREDTSAFILQAQKLNVTDNTYTITNDIFSTLQYENQWLRIIVNKDSLLDRYTACKIISIDTSTKTATIIPEDISGNIPGEMTINTLAIHGNTLVAGTYDVELGAVLNGYDGEVMVLVPEFWIKSWDTDTRREVRISPSKIDDTWEHQPKLLVGAYHDTVLNTVPENMGYLSTLEVNSAISVANSATYCRGGNNDATNDADEDVFRRHLGKCRTNISRATFREYTRKAGKEIMSYRQYKNIMYWLYVIEYANFNSQAEYNSELTTEGFHQGGLGNGITNVTNWGSYNNFNPICTNGYTNNFGNGTGIRFIESLSLEPIDNVYAIRWRGFEDPFGHIWHNVDGIIIDADADNHPNNMNYVYTTDDPSKYGDTLANIANMVLSGLEIHAGGYTKEWDLGSTAEIIPRLMGGNTTQYKCDYHITGNKDTNLRMLLLGGGADNGAYAGLGCFYSTYGVTFSATDVGFRSVLVV